MINRSWAHLYAGLTFLFLACSCSTLQHDAQQSSSFVGKVDFRRAPELKHLAEHTRQFGDEIYPKICNLLLDPATPRPRRFDVKFQPLKSRNSGEAHLAKKTIYINSTFLANETNTLEVFDRLFVHELTHMATQHQSLLERWRHPIPASIGCWGESLADYARYKLVGTNGWSCPSCNIYHPHYGSGYTCGGAFLLYVEANYGTNVIRELAREFRNGSYRDEMFAKTTGRTLETLWSDFKMTSVIKPGIKEATALQNALGYTNGVPPSDAVARFDRFLEEHGSAFVKMALKASTEWNTKFKRMDNLTALYLYLSQPGGSSEEFIWRTMRENHLPGFHKGEAGSMVNAISFEQLIDCRTFPVYRTIVCNKNADRSKYHYTMSRAAEESPWKLEKAWRTLDGKVEDEYPVVTPSTISSSK